MHNAHPAKLSNRLRHDPAAQTSDNPVPVRIARPAAVPRQYRCVAAIFDESESPVDFHLCGETCFLKQNSAPPNQDSALMISTKHQSPDLPDHSAGKFKPCNTLRQAFGLVDQLFDIDPRRQPAESKNNGGTNSHQKSNSTKTLPAKSRHQDDPEGSAGLLRKVCAPIIHDAGRNISQARTTPNVTLETKTSNTTAPAAFAN